MLFKRIAQIGNGFDRKDFRHRKLQVVHLLNGSDDPNMGETVPSR